MSLRHHLPRIIARDPRFSIEAYAFVLEALDRARIQKLNALRSGVGRAGTTVPGRSGRSRAQLPRGAGHVSGRELCESARSLALGQYGLLATTVLGYWGIRSTSDIGDIVYNMIATGDLEKTPSDSRSDFDNVFDFHTALRPKLALAHDDLT
jgi:uncharacterized repeat protein (TIGR04138 family)